MPSGLHSVYMLLGANLGDRLHTLTQARTLIAERIGTVSRQSAIYETAPWGVTDQPTYLNQVLIVETELMPEAVLKQTQAIETELGRIRLEKWGARLIDIDLLYYDQLVLETTFLTLPHPYLHQRRFTLVPLSEVAPDFEHPVRQETSLSLLEALTDDSDVHRFNQ